MRKIGKLLNQSAYILSCHTIKTTYQDDRNIFLGGTLLEHLMNVPRYDANKFDLPLLVNIHQKKHKRKRSTLNLNVNITENEKL